MTAQDIRLQANFTACVASYDAPTTTWTHQNFYPGNSWILDTAEFSPVAAPGLLAVQMTNGVSNLTGTNYGMLGDDNDATTIIMGSYRFKAGNSNLTYPQMMRTEQASIFSSGEPTAASKLYCYRIIVPLTDGAGATTLQVPAARFYLTGVKDNEPDLEYMMRLKRSYELDQN